MVLFLLLLLLSFYGNIIEKYMLLLVTLKFCGKKMAVLESSLNTHSFMT
jgi:hypothetical protein